VNLASLIEEHPSDAPALFDRGRWWSWGEVRRSTASVAAGLVELGVEPAERVAIAWPTSADFVFAYLGVLAAGAVAVPLNPNSPSAEIEGELSSVEPRVVIAGGGASAACRDAVSRARGAKPETVLDEAGEGDRRWGDLLTDGAAVARRGGGFVLERSDDDLAVLLFTSGTAGAPRAAMLSHRNLVSNIRQMLSVPGIFGADDVGLGAVPMFHVFGLNVVLGMTLATGASLVLEERFDPSASLELVRSLGVTTLVGVPTMFGSWVDLRTDGGGDRSLGKVRRAIAGAAALPVEVAQSFETTYGIPVWQGYGLTEASPAVSSYQGNGAPRPGSVGRPLPGVELRIVDDNGEEALQGDPGEIWVRGPNVFAGYWRDPEATAEVLTADGWLRTGDVGILSEDAELYVVDRKKDLVIVSGFNVYPAEVEKVIAGLEGVAGVVVVGRADPVTGESVEAVVLREPGSSVTEQDVRSRCGSQLARYKCPATVRFVDELPTGLAGKALRRAVRGQA
jgi:long-chain acyl-CoA synthetase